MKHMVCVDDTHKFLEIKNISIMGGKLTYFC